MLIFKRMSTAFLIASFLLLLACTGTQQTEFQVKKENLKQRAQDTLDKLDEKIESLKYDIQDKQEDADQMAEENLEKLENQKEQLSEQINKLGETTQEKWQDFEIDFNSLIQDIEMDLQELTS